uniref:Uncharacterized protein MANES_05G045200 n=1 Tax=Rhizophora mucronata TaxID=61149 RepID=A0A2P2JH90_RHIMU
MIMCTWNTKVPFWGLLMMLNSGFRRATNPLWSIDLHRGWETLTSMPIEKGSRSCEWSWRRKDGLLRTASEGYLHTFYSFLETSTLSAHTMRP